MKKISYIVFLIYYLFGTFCLPMGNFAVVSELPSMYKHCKNSEDKDMNVVDFITDHLLNLDGIFDEHKDGDDQKPHSSSHHAHYIQLVYIKITLFFEIKTVKLFLLDKLQIIKSEDNYVFNFSNFLFRPPLV